uniref:Uncharacterized protein n=1 Tax=Onchocerca volvulus TaxID=6282 RepID=A0A8R1XVA0_ONCVO
MEVEQIVDFNNNFSNKAAINVLSFLTSNLASSEKQYYQIDASCYALLSRKNEKMKQKQNRRKKFKNRRVFGKGIANLKFY